MTSLEIAELTGKQHFHVMEAIRKMEPAWVKVNGRNFALVEYKDAKGELRPITRCQARCDTSQKLNADLTMLGDKLNASFKSIK